MSVWVVGECGVWVGGRMGVWVGGRMGHVGEWAVMHPPRPGSTEKPCDRNCAEFGEAAVTGGRA
jgi:hypothetical protein